MPENWYDYENKGLANLVTKGTDASGTEQISYWTYIPRSEYNVDDLSSKVTNKAKIRFIPKTHTTRDPDFLITETFKYTGQVLSGYWVSKYEVQGTID